MRGRLRAAGWGLVAVGVIVWTAVVVVGAFSAPSDAAFNRWVGWATIAALPIASAGVLPVLWDKGSGYLGLDSRLRAVEDELCRVMLSQAQVARSRLIGPGEPEDQAANVPFLRVLRVRGAGGATSGELSSVLEYYQSLSPGRLVVLGEPGAGKTVLALELQVRLLEARDAEPGAPVPVLVSAAAYNNGQAWEAWLAGHLAVRFGIRRRTAERLVRDRRILPLVDGLDEMDPAGSAQPDRARNLVKALNSVMRGHERAPVVVTCRRGEYSAVGPGIDRATHVDMVGLAGGEAASYLRGQFRTPAEKNRWGPVLAALEQEPDGAVAARMSTPWRLTLALAAFRDGGDPTAFLSPPNTEAGGDAQHLDAVLLRGYVQSAVRLHSAGTPYTEQKVLWWLTALADGLDWQADHGMSATDIVPHQWWQQAGQVLIRGIHVVVAILPAIAIIIARGDNGSLLLIDGLWLFVGARRAINPRPSPRRISIRGIATRQGLRSLMLGFVTGIVFEYAIWLLFFRSESSSALLMLLLLFGLLAGLFIGLRRAIMGSAPDDRGPRGVIRADGIFGLTVGPVFGLAFMLVSWLVYWLNGSPFFYVSWLLSWIAFGIAFGVSGWGRVWTRFHIAASVMAFRGEVPLRFGAFLDWAVDAGLLRASGVAYQFRHRQLQDWLTSEDDRNAGKRRRLKSITLESRNNLAVAHGDAGRKDEALALLEQVLAAYERLLGAEHPNTEAVRRNLAALTRLAKAVAAAPEGALSLIRANNGLSIDCSSDHGHDGMSNGREKFTTVRLRHRQNGLYALRYRERLISLTSEYSAIWRHTDHMRSVEHHQHLAFRMTLA